jgi:hypothetical protein
MLLKKEAAQSWGALIALFVLMWLVVGVNWLAVDHDAVAPSPLEAVARGLMLYLPIAGLILGHRIVVLEYHGRTQRFLEALPIQRHHMVLAKYLFGLTVLFGLCLTAFAVSAGFSGEATGRFLGLLALRYFAHSAALWSTLFAMGLLGRFRLAAYVALATALYLLDGVTPFELSRFGPVTLVDPMLLVYERTDFPARALLESAGVALGFLAVALGLALVREGTTAEVLARRASQREKSALALFVIASLVIASVVEAKKPKTPFAFSSSTVVRGARSDTSIMYGLSELAPHAHKLAAELDTLVTRLEQELGIDDYPPIRVAHSSVTAAREIRNKFLPDADGIFLEFDLGERAFLVPLLYEAAHAGLIWTTDGQAAFEPQHWLLDGYSTFVAAEQVPEVRERLWLAALVATRHAEIDAERLLAWEQILERLGEQLANALAFALVDELVTRHGRDTLRRLARTLLAQHSATALGAWLERRREPPLVGLERIVGRPWQEVVEQWLAALERRRGEPAWAARLSELTSPRAQLELNEDGAALSIDYELAGPASAEPRECALRHQALAPYDLSTGESSLEREEIEWAARVPRVSGRLRGRYGSGQRVLVALECWVPRLGANERLLSRRLTLP